MPEPRRGTLSEGEGKCLKISNAGTGAEDNKDPAIKKAPSFA
jgi:hypothetical protein